VSRLRIGIPGAGGIARSVHLPVLAEMGDVELRALCGHVPGWAEEAAKPYHTPGKYLFCHDMLSREEPDAVFVLVPPDGLFRAAADCLLAGKHMFMEKPIGITLFQAASLKDLAEKQNRVLHVGFNRRFIPLAANPEGGDPARTAEDYSSMELAEDLLKARIKKAEFPC
jgi:predicted dehydrogenase